MSCAELGTGLLDLESARARLIAAATPSGLRESCRLENALDRVLAEDLHGNPVASLVGWQLLVAANDSVEEGRDYAFLPISQFTD
ncbi:hypothetical protein [Litchfieldella rifensis]|uniref:Uncharacterized protein n=1 Tax=Litchfieldella rifensis TaxID=762643 RepID=A0ABV7LIH7_9GAMM